ncbi:hypothetical protein, partial [Deinococcus sp. ME38]|uniref:hypothetical protein n=1 Tax=Deinococcus sp. ME38 TaxID=3400344 RepID=UPI003B5B7544
FDGTGAGPVEMPESVSVMRQRGGQRDVFDALIIIYLIGVRIRALQLEIDEIFAFQDALSDAVT